MGTPFQNLIKIKAFDLQGGTLGFVLTLFASVQTKGWAELAAFHWNDKTSYNETFE